VVLVPCLAVNGSLHKGLLGHIQFSQAVDYDMYMNVAAAIVTVHVRTDQCLMPRKICFCVFQSKLLCPFPRQAIFCAVLWVKADDVIFELGLFMGHLSRSRTLIAVPQGGKVKLASDLQGLTILDYKIESDQKVDVINLATALRNHIKTLGPKKIVLSH
jgi:hypothetical protein